MSRASGKGLNNARAASAFGVQQSLSQSAGGGGGSPASFFSVSKFNFVKWSEGSEGKRRGTQVGEVPPKSETLQFVEAYHHALLTPIKRVPRSGRYQEGEKV